MKVGGGAKRNAGLEQSAQVSTATQRAATTTRHGHTEKLSEDTYQPQYSPRPAKREGRGRGKLLHKGTICSSKELQFSSVYLATIHYEVQHKKELSHGKGAQKKP